MVRTVPVISLKLFENEMSVISSKHCLCLQLELGSTGTLIRPNSASFLGLKIRVLPHHSQNCHLGTFANVTMYPHSRDFIRQMIWTCKDAIVDLHAFKRIIG